MIDRVETVAYGRPATIALARAIEQAQAGRALVPVTVIVPSNLAGLTARRILGGGFDDRPGGVANVSFVTPFRLVELLAADLLLDRRPLTNPVLGAAVRAALADDPGRYAAVADHHATEAALAALYAELSNVRPATLDRLAAEGGEAARSAIRFHRAISSHLGAFHDEGDVATAVASRPDLVGAVAALGPVIWYLPAPMSAPLVEAIGAVLAAGPSSVVVGLAGDTEADAGVLATCRRAGADVSISDTAAPPVAGRILSVTDADEEVRAVVRAVASLAESGATLDRVGVFFPVADPYLAILEQQLAAAGIPANGPGRKRLADTVAGRTLQSALALSDDQWRRDRVMALVSGAPVRQHDGESARPASWDAISREAGVIQGPADWQAKLAAHGASLTARAAALPEARSERERQAELTTAARLAREQADIEALATFVRDLGDRVEAVERAATWKDKTDAATDLLAGLLGPGHRHGRWPDDEQAAFERVEDALTRLATLDEIEPTPGHTVFLRALSAELEVTRGRSGRFGQGVHYGPLASAVGHDLDAVFVLGCVEGLCPAPRREDSLLSDEVRAMAGGELDAVSGRQDDQHRTFLAALAAAPPPARTLLMGRGDLRSHQEALPSRWLVESVAAHEDKAVFATDVVERPDQYLTVVPSFSTGLLDAPVAASLTERDLAAVHRHAIAAGSAEGHPVAERVGRALEAQRLRRSAALTEWDGNLAGQVIGSTTDRPQSPSRLESWAVCGFRYFLQHVLGLRARDDPERVIELDPRDRGSGVHKVLERFIEEAIAEGPPAPGEAWSPAQRARIQPIADEVFAELERQGRTGRSILWQLTKADLRALIEGFLDADDAHRATTASRPVRVELAFGFDGAEPVRIPLPDGRVLQFRGYADRVDGTDDGGLVVSDYKTGKPDKYKSLVDDDPVQAGTTLQLGLYSEAARQQLGDHEVEAGYWMVDGTGRERYGYRWTEERRQRLLDVLTTVTDAIEAGSFPAVPGEWNTWRSTHDACVWCAFDTVCPRDRGEQAEAKLADPAVRRRDPLAWEVPS